jgi:hypothetical protein
VTTATTTVAAIEKQLGNPPEELFVELQTTMYHTMLFDLFPAFWEAIKKQASARHTTRRAPAAARTHVCACAERAELDTQLRVAQLVVRWPFCTRGRSLICDGAHAHAHAAHAHAPPAATHAHRASRVLCRVSGCEHGHLALAADGRDDTRRDHQGERPRDPSLCRVLVRMRVCARRDPLPRCPRPLCRSVCCTVCRTVAGCGVPRCRSLCRTVAADPRASISSAQPRVHPIGHWLCPSPSPLRVWTFATETERARRAPSSFHAAVSTCARRVSRSCSSAICSRSSLTRWTWSRRHAQPNPPPPPRTRPHVPRLRIVSAREITRHVSARLRSHAPRVRSSPIAGEAHLRHVHRRHVRGAHFRRVGCEAELDQEYAGAGGLGRSADQQTHRHERHRADAVPARGRRGLGHAQYGRVATLYVPRSPRGHTCRNTHLEARRCPI